MNTIDDSIDFFPDCCILPKSGSEASTGYYTFGVGVGKSGLTQGAHRLSYRLFIGPIPEEMNVMHSCDKKWCINPRHLYLGTSVDSGNKSARKTQGENNYQSVLTEEKVRSILASEEGSTALGKKYGVTRQCISRIRAGISWRHIKRSDS